MTAINIKDLRTGKAVVVNVHQIAMLEQSDGNETHTELVMSSGDRVLMALEMDRVRTLLRNHGWSSGPPAVQEQRE